MTLEHSIRLLAGTLVLTGLSLGWWIDSRWFLLTAFVGLNLIQSSITGWCFAESILKRYVFNRNNDTPRTRG